MGGRTNTQRAASRLRRCPVQALPPALRPVSTGLLVAGIAAGGPARAAQPEVGRTGSVPSEVAAERRDDFDLAVRASSNVQVFRRALLPGPAGAILRDETLAPLHQSLSLHAARVDTPLAEDGLEIQLATWGMFIIGSPEEMQTATWDISSAFVRQRFRNMALTLGRMPVAGRAARYSRMDGATFDASLGTDFTVGAYGGWTVLPRFQKWYGVHHLGDGRNEWVHPEADRLVPEREQNWMAGARLQWKDARWGSMGVSFHYQAENASAFQKNLGANLALTALDDWDFRADGVIDANTMRLSDARATAVWDALRGADWGLLARAEVLHTVPSLLMSQASVFSVFSYEQVTEAGAQLDARLPAGFRADASGYAQSYQEGEPGYRLALGSSFKTQNGKLYLRVRGERVKTLQNGYFMVRVAGSYQFMERVTLTLDGYQYFYDDAIRDVHYSSFYAAHVGYKAASLWDARLGGSITSSPYAALDAQALARWTIFWDATRGAP